ncbi:hypothetical protein ABL78_1211 [Leptomonas seymouri]|uniref:Uncharacterized protein n=1 Tax=Leptomonas seymouri TaxID=5684 RepID=A0A0N1I2L4_LEPSE|nr:hypothetical protein ABL78_1211 [Leptomonas seymouri]|eukprot:KPI89718.1 hypothetical protein ABL78_1211 [Leptomonas seymouri]
MFSPAQVEVLFASTTLTLQRSQLLFDERRTSVVGATTLPPTFCQLTPSVASTAVGAGASSGYSSSSSSFAETVRSLQSLGQFRAFVEAITAMQSKVEGELQNPSAALQQRRSKGHDFALLQSVTRGLRGAAAAPWRMSDATTALWAGSAVSDDGEAALDDVQPSSITAAALSSSADGIASAHSSHAPSSGAQVTAALLFGALCVDVALAVPRVAPAIAAGLQRVFESPTRVLDVSGKSSSDSANSSDSDAIAVTAWSREGDARLQALLRAVAALLPKRVMGRLIERVADLLLRPPPHALARRTGPSHRGCQLLSGGQFLFPAFCRYLLEHYPSSLAPRWLLKPLQTAAQQLRADYYRSAAELAVQCRWLLSVVFTLVRACQVAEAEVEPSRSSAALPVVERQVRTVQRVYDAWLMPLERTFGHESARHGMSAMFYQNLVLPHSQLAQQLRCYLVEQGPQDTTDSYAKNGGRTWSGTLHTAQYRLLMMLEKLAQSEVAQANGTSSNASKQRTYEALLRQNGGKVSVPLLQALAEDKQLVLEETPSRSPDGHRLYRLHDGMLDGAGGGARAVFVYVDDGALFTKVGRSRVFQRVKSVEDIFRPLQ